MGAEMNIWKRGHLNVNDPKSFPKEFLAPCIEEGYAVVQTMLNPKHPKTTLDQVPLEYLVDIRELGAKAWGFVWADDFESPDECFNFVRGWRERSMYENCALTGFVINAEDKTEERDQAGESWSWKFLTRFRNHPATQKVSLALNTYNGCGGLSLPTWQNKGARLYCQTFHEENTHEWPIDGYVSWAKYYGYTKKSMIRPNWSTYKAPDGSRASRDEQIKTAQWAGTMGFSAWYAEGAGDPAEVLIPLLREARLAGVCE
jgi:hypothetical protein